MHSFVISPVSSSTLAKCISILSLLNTAELFSVTASKSPTMLAPFAVSIPSLSLENCLLQQQFHPSDVSASGIVFIHNATV